MKITITPTQYEILEDRLTLPDCIHEVFNDTDELPNCTEEEVETSVNKIDTMAKAGFLDFALLTDFDKLVLEDVLDGTTFLTGAEEAVGQHDWWSNAPTPQKYQGYLRAAENLEDKIEKVWKRVTIRS